MFIVQAFVNKNNRKNNTVQIISLRFRSDQWFITKITKWIFHFFINRRIYSYLLWMTFQRKYKFKRSNHHSFMYTQSGNTSFVLSSPNQLYIPVNVHCYFLVIFLYYWISSRICHNVSVIHLYTRLAYYVFFDDLSRKSHIHILNRFVEFSARNRSYKYWTLLKY